MEITTAIDQLNKEREFLGLGMLELLQDIEKDGAMVYCEKTMRAYRVFMRQASHMFAIDWNSNNPTWL